MLSLDKVENELEVLGYETFRVNSPSRGAVVAIKYKILEGKHKDKEMLLGFSFHSGEESYPEYPPHWIHISPPYDDGCGGAMESYMTNDNGVERQWLALSRPPSDIWDNLSTKHMSQYLQIHISRFCRYLQ